LGIPGLGDLMITSITNANEPVINGVVFLSAAAITLGTLLADIAQGMFDPRIRLS
jgi:ABC-type dipeptide/oligopeptide/nickel transport system permease component